MGKKKETATFEYTPPPPHVVVTALSQPSFFPPLSLRRII